MHEVQFIINTGHSPDYIKSTRLIPALPRKTDTVSLDINETIYEDYEVSFVNYEISDNGFKIKIGLGF